MGWRVQLSVIVAAAFLFRMATFGDPALHTDEEFYFYVGQKMLDGRLPYVDIWDRKPLGLFLIYAGIASISRSIIAYQIAATLSAAATAFLITRIVNTRWPAQLTGAFMYLALLPWLGGFGGQSPVFYNLLMAGAVFLTLRSLGEIGRSAYLAMGLCGVALTVKQTVIVEAVFLGLFMLWAARGIGWRKLVLHAAGFAVVGILPTALIALAYVNHWPEFYQAMVTSNLSKQGYSLGWRLNFARGLFTPLWLPLLLSAAGLAVMPTMRLFFGGWLLSATAALLLVPNFYWHYGLPILLPICCCVAYLFDRWWWTIPIGLGVGAYSLWRFDAFNFERHRIARENVEAIADSIKGARSLLVYDGPVYLYAMTDAKPLSRLVFPWHLQEKVEDGASGRSQYREVRRILAQKPEAVTFRHSWGTRDNRTVRVLVRDYVEQRCRPVLQRDIYESQFRQRITVYRDCR